MTGREFLELDSPQQRLYLERFKRMEVIQKMLDELPKADHFARLASTSLEVFSCMIGSVLNVTLSTKMQKNFKNVCNHGTYFLAANSSLCGIAANTLFRNILHVRKASFVSSLPMAIIPFLSTAAFYEVFVREPLFSGDLNCEVCAVVRGGLTGAVIGGFYPVLLALPLNASLAARYSSSPLPGKENLLRYWLTTARPVFRKMSLVVLVQAITGLYLATKHHGIYVKILQQMNTSSRDPEELEA